MREGTGVPICRAAERLVVRARDGMFAGIVAGDHGRAGGSVAPRRGKSCHAGPTGQRAECAQRGRSRWRTGLGRQKERGRHGASGCSGPSAWEWVGRSARSAGEENGAVGMGRVGERKRGNGPAGFGLFCWAGLVSGFLFSGLLSPFLFLFLNNSNLFEFKFKFEFNSNTQTNKRDAPA
jgi:hypothetical protein